MTNELRELFEECIDTAIKIGRRFMHDTTMSKKPTQQEWDLALLLLKLKKEDKL